MAAVNYTVRLDESDKKAAEQVFNQLGLTLAAGLNVYVKAVARWQRIPFDLALGEPVALTSAQTAAISRTEKEKSFQALNGVLAGHDIDLDKEQEERILGQ